MFRRNCAGIIETLDSALDMMHRNPIAQKMRQEASPSGIDDLIADRPSASGGAPIRASPMHAHTVEGEQPVRQSVQIPANGEYSYIVPPVISQNDNTDVMWLLDSKSNEQGRNLERGTGPLGGRSHPSGAFPKTAPRMDNDRSSTPVLPETAISRQQVDRNTQFTHNTRPQTELSSHRQIRFLTEQLEAATSENQTLKLSAASQKVNQTVRPTAQIMKAPMTMRLPYQLSMFSGTGEIDFPEWIRTFERTTKACQVRGKALLDCLEAYLDGPALYELTSLKPPPQDFETAKAHLTLIFQSSSQARRAALTLMNRTQKEGESIIEYSTALAKLARTAYPAKTVEEIDFLLNDRFTSGVQAGYIKLCDFDLCTSFRESAQLAKRCEDRTLAAADAAVNKKSSSTKSDVASDLVLSSLSSDTLDAFKTEILNSVRATVGNAYQGQQHDNSQGRGYQHQPRSFRGAANNGNSEWTADGKPICRYCQKVNHKYRDCRKRLYEEANAASRGRGSGYRGGRGRGGPNYGRGGYTSGRGGSNTGQGSGTQNGVNTAEQVNTANLRLVI